jgi:ribonuclease HII
MSTKAPSLRFERAFWSRGLKLVAGLDEVGRGAWAGPVVACAAILPQLKRIPRSLALVRDSKLLSPEQRDMLVEPIREAVLAHAIGAATRTEVDEMGIVPATKLAMKRALDQLNTTPMALLIDAVKLSDIKLPQRAIIHGDQLSLSIACASILAKVARDRMMVEMDDAVPGYAFGQHKGYGTPQHRAAVEKLGASIEHRVSFEPIKLCLFSQAGLEISDPEIATE